MERGSSQKEQPEGIKRGRKTQKLTTVDIGKLYSDSLKEMGNYWRRYCVRISVTVQIEQKRPRLLSLSLCLYIYIYIYVCVCIYIYIYIYIIEEIKGKYQ